MKTRKRATIPVASKKKGAAKRSGASASGASSSPRRSKSEEASLEMRLLKVVSTVDVAYALTMPLIRSIENLLYIAARALGSGEASVLVRDGERGGLRFLVAIGAVADKLLKVRIPPGKGIAGFVFASGQPMVVADVHRESAFYEEVDRMTGYTTQTILATPLQVNGETVGVLEFINRLGRAPYEPFSPNEMDWAARFADAIATLVDAHETAGLVEMLFRRTMQSMSEEAAAEEKTTTQRSKSASRKRRAAGESEDLQRWISMVRAAPEPRELLSLAGSLREVASRGDAERRLCRDILNGLARWTEERRAATPGASYFQ